jgi:anaerobic magnesium-protoporphyrin IX monomethyl ester cyclase
MPIAATAEHGALDVSDWSKFNYRRPVFVPHGLTREQLLAKHREFYRRFYFRPRILWRYMLSFLSPSGIKRLGPLLKSLPLLLFREKNKQPADIEPTPAHDLPPIPRPKFHRSKHLVKK